MSIVYSTTAMKLLQVCISIKLIYIIIVWLCCLDKFQVTNLSKNCNICSENLMRLAMWYGVVCQDRASIRFPSVSVITIDFWDWLSTKTSCSIFNRSHICCRNARNSGGRSGSSVLPGNPNRILLSFIPAHLWTNIQIYSMYGSLIKTENLLMTL